MNIIQINAARALARRIGYAREADRAAVALLYPNLSVTTANQFHALTVPGLDSEAVGALVDAGKEPHLIYKEALEYGLHPFLCIYDVMIARQAISGGRRGRSYNVSLVGLDLHQGLGLFSPDALIAWRS